MPIDTGGPAYPTAQMVYKTLPHGAETIKAGEPGLSLLDHFAGLAMASILQTIAGIRPCDIPAMCHDAYGIARAMLAEKRRLEKTDATT